MGYFICFVVGGIFGVLIMCMIVVSKDADKRSGNNE